VLASLGTDSCSVILALVPGAGLVLGLLAGAMTAGRTAAVPPPGGLELAGADADGP
jgi:hypothetical protein